MRPGKLGIARSNPNPLGGLPSPRVPRDEWGPPGRRGANAGCARGVSSRPRSSARRWAAQVERPALAERLVARRPAARAAPLVQAGGIVKVS